MLRLLDKASYCPGHLFWAHTYMYAGLSSVGNFYSHLFADSMDAARQLGHNLTGAVADIANLHTPFHHSSMPHSFKDMLLNSLSHIRYVREASLSPGFPAGGRT